MHKQSSYDSRAFPPGNQLPHAFVSSLPFIRASKHNRLDGKLLSLINNVHNSIIVIQSLSFLKRTFDSKPMVI